MADTAMETELEREATRLLRIHPAELDHPVLFTEQLRRRQAHEVPLDEDE